jgi:hypothetical protein
LTINHRHRFPQFSLLSQLSRLVRVKKLLPELGLLRWTELMSHRHHSTKTSIKQAVCFNPTTVAPSENRNFLTNKKQKEKPKRGTKKKVTC